MWRFCKLLTTCEIFLRGKCEVDFLVDLEPGRTISDLGGLLMDLQEVLGAPVDVVAERGLRVRVRERVLAEAVVL